MSKSWGAGYITDIGYTFGYYAELNPLLMQLAFAKAGYKFPKVKTACELGFGQGLSCNIHASATQILWSGTDFISSQASFAQELANHAENKAMLYDESFSEFCSRSDLPDFDFIGLHGVWSWISEENRSIIVNFIANKLKVDGVLYIGYNTQPGWASMIPVRDLMVEQMKIGSASGDGVLDSIEQTLKFTERLSTISPEYFKANPNVDQQLKKLQAQNKSYLAHEYFNRDWAPMSFSKLSQSLTQAKMDYVCSASYTEHLDAINLTSEQQKFLEEIRDPIHQQSVRDFITNSRFRKDYWAKGARKLTLLEQIETIRGLKIILIKDKAEITPKVIGTVGEVTINEVVYTPLVEILSDYEVKTIGQLEELVRSHGIVLSQIIEAIMMLGGIGVIAAAQDDDIAAKVKESCNKLNLALMLKSRSTNELGYLASPVTGGGIPINRFHQLFLLGLNQGCKTPEECASFVWKIMNEQGQKLIVEGQTLDAEEQNLVELTRQISLFVSSKLPILKALQIA